MSVVLGSAAAAPRQPAADELARTLAEFQASEPQAPSVELPPPVADSGTLAALPRLPTGDEAAPPTPRTGPDDEPVVPAQPRRHRRQPAARARRSRSLPDPVPIAETEPPVPPRHEHVPIPDLAAPTVARRTEFAPRRALQRLLGLLVLLALLAAVATSALAWHTRETRDVVFAGIMVALAFVLASIRATINPVDLIIEAGQLHVRHGHLQEVHDLTSAYTDVTITGDENTPTWEVVISRYDAPTRRIGHDVVDGAAFVPVVLYWRPDAQRLP